MKNIQADELMEALGVSRIENLTYALSRLPGRDDIERLKAFCDEHKIGYEYSVEDAYLLKTDDIHPPKSVISVHFSVSLA